MYVILHTSVITQEGYSPLMVAAKGGRTEVVVELVKSGADLNLQNKVCHMYIPLVSWSEVELWQTCSNPGPYPGGGFGGSIESPLEGCDLAALVAIQN